MKFIFLPKEKMEKLPENTGVYVFKNAGLLYIGKAANIKERVKNHFPSRSEGERRTNVLRTQQPSFRDNLFINQVLKIGFIKTGSEIEALILEANLIKKYQPKYNVVWRDDKNYFYIGVTKEDFPRVFITHQPIRQAQGKPKLKIDYIGPFVDGAALKQTLKILRKVFPYRSCNNIPKHSCLWYHLNRCPAPCSLKISTDGYPIPIKLDKKMRNECEKNARNIVKILQGKKVGVLKDLKKEMKKNSIVQDFEKAAKIRDQIVSLEKVISHARIFESAEEPIGVRPQQFQIQKILQKILKMKRVISRIEAYDVSNIQGQTAAGSMVTFIDSSPDKNFYRKFKVRISGKPNDVAMIKEVLSRRLKHIEWPYPQLMLIDGGKAQLNAALNVLNQHKSAKSALISVVALAKKKNELFIENKKEPILLKTLPREIFNLILQLRDEAHRFARKYHHKLREIDFLS